MQLCQGNGRGGRCRVGFIESSRGGRGAGVSDIDVPIRHFCGQPSVNPCFEDQQEDKTDRAGVAAVQVLGETDAHVDRAGC